MELLNRSINQNQAQTFVNPMHAGKLALPEMDGMLFVSLEDVLYFKADGNYTRVYLKSGKKHLVSRSMTDFEEKLAGFPFIRTHRSYIVNLRWIMKYVRGRGGYVIMDDGTAVEVSARKRETFLEALNTFFC